jgi:hypothetical protein
MHIYNNRRLSFLASELPYKYVVRRVWSKGCKNTISFTVLWVSTRKRAEGLVGQVSTLEKKYSIEV